MNKVDELQVAYFPLDTPLDVIYACVHGIVRWVELVTKSGGRGWIIVLYEVW